MPPLEAMACGCPVVVSTAGSVPEIAGDAALLVGPRDAGGLANAVRRIVAEQGMRKELIERGLRRAAVFSWERAARETTAAYETVSNRLLPRVTPVAGRGRSAQEGLRFGRER
ncbi:MAG: glycosyltransferase [Actinomycetota bacterium]|nr:glycosyltransferase [Actinomycetota bacterium]